MRRLSSFLAGILVTLFIPVVALAQVQTGVLSVKAADAQGAVIPGASVTVTSPVLPSALTGTTDSSGVYQIPGLTPGTYTIKVSLQGFQTFVREDVIVLQNQTVSIDAPMKVGTMSEEVTVKGESPIVDTRTVGSKTNIDSTILDTTPGGKDIWNIVEYKATGVVVETPDVGGNQGGLQRSMSARGTPNAQNTQLLNGVNVNDPAAQGFSMNYYIPSAFENMQVSSGAEDIAVGTGGVLMNMVTRSGTNKFSGQALQTYQGKDTQASNVDTTLLNAGFLPNSNSTNLLTNTNVQAGGPLLRNQLFYFGSFNFQATHVGVPGFPAVAPSYIQTPLAGTSNLDTTDILAGEGKITYQHGQKDRFEGYLSKQRYDKPNRAAGVGVTQDSAFKELDTFVVSQLAYNRTMSDRMFLDAKVSYNNTHFPLHQKTDLQSLLDNSTGIRYQNAASFPLMFRRRTQVVTNWNYYVPDLLHGRHEFKAGFDNGYTPETVTTQRAGNVNATFNSQDSSGHVLATPAASTVTVFNSPLVQQRAVMTTAFYGQDSYTYKRLNVIAGLRWERLEGYLPAQAGSGNTQYFPSGTVFQGATINGVKQDYTVPSSFAAIHDDPLWHNWAPRVAGTYDLNGNGRTALKLSYGKYLDQINTGTPPNPNATVSQSYNWNDNGDLVFQPGNAVWNGTQYVGGEFGSLRSTSGLNIATFNKSARRPYRDELIASVDHQLFPNTAIGVAYFHTREHDQQSTPNVPLNQWANDYSAVTLTDPGRDGVLGTADDKPITVYAPIPNLVISPVTINDDRLSQRYNGIDFTVTQRETNFNLLFGYTYSNTKQDIVSLTDPNSVYVNANGVSGGRRHNLKASGSYQWKYGLLFAGNFRLQSGLPVTRVWTISPCTPTLTTNCVPNAPGNLTVNAEPRGSFELPWLPTLDLRAGRFFRMGGGNRLDVSIDCYNVTNANTVFATRTGSTLTPIHVNGDPTTPTTFISTWNSPTQFLAPRVFRFNITYQFGTR